MWTTQALPCNRHKRDVPHKGQSGQPGEGQRELQERGQTGRTGKAQNNQARNGQTDQTMSKPSKASCEGIEKAAPKWGSGACMASTQVRHKQPPRLPFDSPANKGANTPRPTPCNAPAPGAGQGTAMQLHHRLAAHCSKPCYQCKRCPGRVLYLHMAAATCYEPPTAVHKEARLQAASPRKSMSRH